MCSSELTYHCYFAFTLEQLIPKAVSIFHA